MDLQTYLTNAVAASRAEALAKSDQLTLGELILKLEAVLQHRQMLEGYEPDKHCNVVFDFEYLFPTGFDSWRGIYRELALNFYSNPRNAEKRVDPFKLSEFLKLCRETVGKTFEGYKGGEYTMSRQTPIWVANYGNSGDTALIDVVDAEYEIILITGYRNTHK